MKTTLHINHTGKCWYQPELIGRNPYPSRQPANKETLSVACIRIHHLRDKSGVTTFNISCGSAQ